MGRKNNGRVIDSNTLSQQILNNTNNNDNTTTSRSLNIGSDMVLPTQHQNGEACVSTMETSKMARGPWIKYSEYPTEAFDNLFGNLKNVGFTYTCTEEEFKEAVRQYLKSRYPDWMSELRKSIFKKYESLGECYAHNPDCVAPTVWRQMVDKWMDENRKKKSEINKGNRSLKNTAHTTGLVPMAKCRKDMLAETRVEPDPIECFKKFHVKRNGDWASEKAKELHERIGYLKANGSSDSAEKCSLRIYRKAVGPPKKCRVMGWGGGMKPRDVYRSLDDESSKDIRVIPRRKLELKVEKMEEESIELRKVKEQMKLIEEKMNFLTSQSSFQQVSNIDTRVEDEDEEQIESDEPNT